MDKFTLSGVDSNITPSASGYVKFSELSNPMAVRRVLNKDLPSYAKVLRAWDNYYLNPSSKDNNGERYYQINKAYDNTCTMDSPYIVYKNA
jgi:hypothetical protein